MKEKAKEYDAELEALLKSTNNINVHDKGDTTKEKENEKKEERETNNNDANINNVQQEK